MGALNSPPGPELSYQPKEPLIKIRILWKWSLLFVLVLMVWGMWQCGSALRTGAQLSEPAVQQFHRHLDAGQYEEICNEAAEGFCTSGAQGETVRFLKGAHEKLGSTGVAKRGGMNVNSGTNGTFLTVQYDTTFGIGRAVETFTWIKSGNTLKLYRYNVQSNALFLK
jgi:hypothetical protein